jgi:hypothetical protein
VRWAITGAVGSSSGLGGSSKLRVLISGLGVRLFECCFADQVRIQWNSFSFGFDAALEDAGDNTALELHCLRATRARGRSSGVRELESVAETGTL